jgi:hypothetical protein
MTLLHKVIHVDPDDRDHVPRVKCYQCGVEYPDPDGDNNDVCMPMVCPGPDVEHPHLFSLHLPWTGYYLTGGHEEGNRPLQMHVYGGWTIRCDYCDVVWDQHLQPKNAEWECRGEVYET